MIRRFLIILMIVSLALVLLPVTAVATDGNDTPSDIEDNNYNAETTDSENASESEYVPDSENLHENEYEAAEPETTDDDPQDTEYPETEPIEQDESEPTNELHGSNEVIEPEPEPETYDEIINVVLPMNVNFIIDPLELMENGQIHSVPHLFENRSEHDIIITFSDISVTFANDNDFLPMPEPFDYTYETPLKAIYMALGFSSLGEGAFFPVTSPFAPDMTIPIHLQAFGTTTILCEYEDCTGACAEEAHLLTIIRHYRTELSIMGNVSTDPVAPWASGDVMLSLNYNIEVVR